MSHENAQTQTDMDMDDFDSAINSIGILPALDEVTRSKSHSVNIPTLLQASEERGDERSIVS